MLKSDFVILVIYNIEMLIMSPKIK